MSNIIARPNGLYPARLEFHFLLTADLALAFRLGRSFYRSKPHLASIFFQIRVFSLRYGGARRDRTDDLLNANQALSHLSYGPDISKL